VDAVPSLTANREVSEAEGAVGVRTAIDVRVDDYNFQLLRQGPPPTSLAFALTYERVWEVPREEVRLNHRVDRLFGNVAIGPNRETNLAILFREVEELGVLWRQRQRDRLGIRLRIRLRISRYGSVGV